MNKIESRLVIVSSIFGIFGVLVSVYSVFFDGEIQGVISPQMIDYIIPSVFIISICLFYYSINRLKNTNKRLTELVNENKKELDINKKKLNDFEISLKHLSQKSAELSFVFFRDLFALVQASVSKFHQKEKEYEMKIKNAATAKELAILRDNYMDDYARLFDLPAVSIVNKVRETMICLTKHKFDVDENFRVVIKIVHEDKSTSNRKDWEFSNAIWDNNSWSSKIKYYREEQFVKHKINSNSAISALATNKSHFFSKNNLLDVEDSGFRYQNHNEGWQKVYTAKILTTIENRRTNVLYGFVSIDSANKHRLELFSEKADSIPLNMAICLSEALSVLFGEAEDYHNHLEALMLEREGSVVQRNRRVNDV